MSVPVDIFVMDEAFLPAPIPGVDVAAYDPGTHDFVAGATSDVDGRASFMLPGSPDPGTAYEVRFFKLGVNFHGLRTINVFDPETTVNAFEHTGFDTNNPLPMSGSNLLCRCTGVFVDFSGQPIINKTVRFVGQAENLDKEPTLWDNPGKMIAPDSLEVRTDGNGRVSVDLVRTGKFWVSFGDNDDTVWPIVVPNTCAANLIDLIHPFPVEWDWDDTVAPGDTVSVAAGDHLEVPFTVMFTDFTSRATGLEIYFDVLNSDGTVVEATYVSNRGILSLRGLLAGTATITPTLKTGIKPIRWPVPAVTAPALLVNVT